jgi:hypothetical protein
VRFTDGFWQPRAGVTPLFARQVHDIWVDGETLRVFAPTGQVSHRSDTLNRPLLTVTVSSPLENIIRMRVDHFQCGSEKVAFGMPGATQGSAEVTVDDVRGVLRSGELSATVIKGNAWALSFDAGERHLTSSGEKCFEGLPDAGVFKRWTAFGLLSSHSRFHGSTSYRVPWMFDDEAVEVTRRFTKLKLRLMPYLYAAGIEASQSGTPVMRPMQLEFPDDPAVGYLDRQYLLGGDLLVAPVFSPDGTVDVYLPAGTWTNYFTGETANGPVWRSEKHGYLTFYVRDGAVLPLGSSQERPDYDYVDGLVLEAYPSSVPAPGERTVRVTTPEGVAADFLVRRGHRRLTVTSTTTLPFAVRLVGGEAIQAGGGRAELTW